MLLLVLGVLWAAVACTVLGWSPKMNRGRSSSTAVDETSPLEELKLERNWDDKRAYYEAGTAAVFFYHSSRAVTIKNNNNNNKNLLIEKDCNKAILWSS